MGVAVKMQLTCRTKPTQRFARFVSRSPLYKGAPCTVMHLQEYSMRPLVAGCLEGCQTRLVKVRSTLGCSGKYSRAVYQHASCTEMLNPLTCLLQHVHIASACMESCEGANLGARPPKIDSKLVLPEPLGPISASTSPGKQAPETLYST